jgi:hypothetical protein
MRLILSVAAALTVAVSAGRADSKDPLRFFPEQTDIVLKVERPRALVEAVIRHDLAKEAQDLQIVRDFLDSAKARQFFRLVAHFERELGAPWPELIDKLAGGGMAAGLKFAADGNGPVVVVVEGTDEKVVGRFFDLAVSLLEEERTQQGAKEPLKRKSYEGFDGVQLDKDALVARSGNVLLFSNKNDALKAAIDHHVKAGKDSRSKSVAAIASKQAASVLPPNPAAWLWVNLKPVKELPQVKDVLNTPRDNVPLTILAADVLDVARRSDFVAAGLYVEKGDFRVAVRLPAGREGMAPDVELHLPKDPKVTATLPLLEPKGVLFSHTFYFDADTLYQKREQILPSQVAKDFAAGEKQISRFLIGSTLPKFLSQAGVHYRIVATKPEPVTDYKTEPDQRLPAFAVVASMRDPAFAKTMTALIKAGALAAGQAVTLRSWDEEIAGVQAFGYSFPEGGKFPDDPLKLHFNYQPTFGAHKDQYIAASNKGLFRELVGLIDKEDRTQVVTQNARFRVYASGAGEYAYSAPEQSLAATIIGQAVKVGEAKQQTDALFKLLSNLGTVGFEMDYAANQTRIDLIWKTQK